ncbi:MAG: helix-turn-helix domain-containing protein [Monoglobales bacterium]
MQFQKLNEFIDAISADTKAHICLLDISGILSGEVFEITSERFSHTKSFCTAAKTTEKGLARCLACKRKTNRKAMVEGIPFYGVCPYGLNEFVWPVRVGGETKCIVFVGNIVIDEEKTREKIEKSCRITGVNPKLLINCLPDTQKATSMKTYELIAHSVASYISLLAERFPTKQKKMHWAVDALREYVNCHYEEHITLESLSKVYFINSKYLGRLFQNQMGMSFHEYLNKVRLDRCEKLISKTDKPIIDIALGCGFGNVTYMNRLFLKKHGCSPTAYRKKEQKS